MGNRRAVERAGLLAAALASVASLAIGGCRRAAPSPAFDDAGALLHPADHATPNELAEGDEKAFGLPLPRKVTVRARFTDSVYASGGVPLKLLATFVRERLVSAEETEGPGTLTFSKAASKAEPSRILRVELVARDGGTDLTVRDVTPPPADPGLTPEERWRQLGLTPQGTPIDPTHLL